MLPLSDHYRVTIADGGILETEIHGIMTREDVDQYYAALAPVDTMLRQQFGRVLSLVAVKIVQSPTVALHFRTRGLPYVQPGDRCAMVVATVLSKLQVKRLASGENFALFSDREAAIAWLRR